MAHPLKNVLTKGRAADHFRSLMLAYSENAESTFTALANDLASDLKQYNTDIDELMKFVDDVFQQIRNSSGPKFEEVPTTTFGSVNNSSPCLTLETPSNGGTVRSSRIRGNCPECGKSGNLIAGNLCRDCASNALNNTANSTNSQDSVPGNGQRSHCVDCSKRLSVKREAFGICLYCANKRKGIIPNPSRQGQKLEVLDN